MSATRKVVSPLDKAKGYEVIWPNVSPLFEAARPFVGIHFVYFVGESDSGPLKIGVSKDPIARLRKMQTGNPRRLRVEHVLAGDAHIEKLLHEMWEEHAIVSPRNAGRPGAPPGTEWFNPDVRDTLLPIVTTAAEAQIERLAQGTDVSSDEMELLVRQAHIVHGFVVKQREEVRLFAKGDGIVTVSRASRI